MPPSSATTSSRAVVIGDGLPGLLAASALSDHFRQVVVSSKLTPSDTVPLLLHQRDQQELERLFPGIIVGLIAAGAVRFNLGLHVAWSVNGRWRPRYRSMFESLACSPRLLEERLRDHLAARLATSFLPNTLVLGAEVNTDTAQVADVRLSTGGMLAADLVVDASGQARKTPSIGEPFTATGRLYQRRAATRESWHMLVVQPGAGQARRGAVILPLEGNQLHLTLFGAGADVPPLAEAGVEAFARTLPLPHVYELVRQATPLSPIELLPLAGVLPDLTPPTRSERCLPLPAPARALNPVLPQVVSQSLSCHTALCASLAHGLDGISACFEQQLHQHLHRTHAMIASDTQQWAGVVESGDEQMSRYMEQVLATSLRSAHVLEALYTVQQMIEPLEFLFRPNIVLDVVGHAPA